MATFTMTLEEAIEFEDGKIGLDDYPIFDEDYRPALNKKIIDHYWNQEIGMETVSMFRHAMKRRMNEIMPLYNEHYKLSRLGVDPLSTVSIKTIANVAGESKGTAETETTSDGSTNTETISNGTNNNETVSDGSSENSSLSDAKSRAVASDTPQNALSENGDYATSMQDNVSDSRASGEATETNTTRSEGAEASTTTGEGTERVRGTGTESRGEQNTQATDSSTEGYSGHAPALIYAARQALVNVDMLIINELQDLFMLIWSNNDSYTKTRIGYGYAY